MSKKTLSSGKSRQVLPRRDHPDYQRIYRKEHWEPDEEEARGQNRIDKFIERLTKEIGFHHYITEYYEYRGVSREEIKRVWPRLNNNGSHFLGQAIQMAFDMEGEFPKLNHLGPQVIINNPYGRLFYRVKEHGKNCFNIGFITAVDILEIGEDIFKLQAHINGARWFEGKVVSKGKKLIAIFLQLNVSGKAIIDVLSRNPSDLLETQPLVPGTFETWKTYSKTRGRPRKLPIEKLLFGADSPIKSDSFLFNLFLPFVV